MNRDIAAPARHQPARPLPRRRRQRQHRPIAARIAKPAIIQHRLDHVHPVVGHQPPKHPVVQRMVVEHQPQRLQTLGRHLDQLPQRRPLRLDRLRVQYRVLGNPPHIDAQIVQPRRDVPLQVRFPKRPPLPRKTSRHDPSHRVQTLPVLVKRQALRLEHLPETTHQRHRVKRIPQSTLHTPRHSKTNLRHVRQAPAGGGASPMMDRTCAITVSGRMAHIHSAFLKLR